MVEGDPATAGGGSARVVRRGWSLSPVLRRSEEAAAMTMVTVTVLLTVLVTVLLPVLPVTVLGEGAVGAAGRG
jgi:hypothetical protein